MMVSVVILYPFFCDKKEEEQIKMKLHYSPIATIERMNL